MKDADVLKVPLESEQNFPKFLKKVRKEENVCLEQLAEGLMTTSQLARIEKGQRPIPKNMRDRLLGRLGIASDLYENLLNIEDHAAWECQRNILHAVERRDTQRAWKLIIAYENETPRNDKIKQQFCLMMEAEVLKQQNVDQSDIASCYERAVKYTVPDIENLCLEKKLLSIQEINMVLEYEFYHKGEDFAEKCGELMTFVENTVYDDLSKVKIYPKIVYYYLREVFIGQAEQLNENLKERLRICKRAIEMLRENGRAFFLMELLEIKIKILEGMGKQAKDNEELVSECQESIELVNLLKKLFLQYNVPVYMQNSTYMYQQRWVFYIGDVLRIRRKMYGFTQKELCEGVCSVRTLRRAEKKEANMQHEYLDALLRKLGLPKEFQRARLVTTDKEVLKLKKKIFTSRNNRDFNRCRELLGQISEKVSLKIPENQQYVIEMEASLDWREGKISNEEFVAREKAALQCTINMKQMICSDEMYLTELELLCIWKIMQGLEGSEKKKYIDFLLSFFELCEKAGRLSDSIVMYEHIMVSVASELGNRGECQYAINLDKKVLKEDLMCSRIWMIGSILYDILWSKMEQGAESGELVDKVKITENLRECILFSRFCKQSFYEQFFEEKMNQPSEAGSSDS